MGSCSHCLNSHNHLHLLIVTLLLLITAQTTLLVEGTSSHRLLQGTEGQGEEKLATRALIGSRPPRCERRCITCGHCEAVQVPAVPQQKNGVQQFSTRIASSYDDSTNYKPMSWKCKCGNMIFNP